MKLPPALPSLLAYAEPSEVRGEAPLHSLPSCSSNSNNTTSGYERAALVSVRLRERGLEAIEWPVAYQRIFLRYTKGGSPCISSFSRSETLDSSAGPSRGSCCRGGGGTFSRSSPMVGAAAAKVYSQSGERSGVQKRRGDGGRCSSSNRGCPVLLNAPACLAASRSAAGDGRSAKER